MNFGLLLMLALETSEVTGPNKTCCFPDYSNKVYYSSPSSGRVLNWQELFNKTTGNMMHRHTSLVGITYRRGDTGAMYRRKPGGNCRYAIVPEMINLSKCMKESYIYEGSLTRHGRVFYRWRDHTEVLYSDTNCVTYPSFVSDNGFEFVPQTNPDVSIIDTFNTSGCVEVANQALLYPPFF